MYHQMVRSSTHGDEKSHRRVDVKNTMNTYAYIYICMCTCIWFHTKFAEIGTIRRSLYDPTREITVETAKCIHSAPCDLLLHTASCLHLRSRLCHKGMDVCVCPSLSLFLPLSLCTHTYIHTHIHAHKNT
eukprot:Tamp_34632.p1 GENE.Tamp_34632~~Tamp_34632.p1  ORF type:complete len:130 (+),score=0.70 Tamp_34632:141-530(+)